MRTTLLTVLVISLLCVGGCERTVPAPSGSPCPTGMVLIPAGSVRSDWTPAHPRQWRIEAEPRAVAAFCIDRYEYPNQKGVKPRTQVSWAEAVRLCDDVGKRLCREDEWELACSNGQDWEYVYGPEREADRCNTGQTMGDLASIAPAGSYPECVNQWGVYDLNGNVSEWVAQTESDLGGTNGVVRGGTAWATEEYGQSCWSRHSHPINDNSYGDDGLRCCLDARSE